MSVSASAIAQLAALATQSAPPEIYTARFVTSLTAGMIGLRPTVISVAATLPALAQGTFSIAIYDAGTDASPVNFEALEVIGGGGSLNWTVVTEASWLPGSHASGSTVVATVLTPRSIQQPLSNHVTVTATPNPHPIYIRQASFTSPGQILVGTNPGQFINLPVGMDGTSLVADSAQQSGIKWATLSITSILQHMGDLIVGSVLGATARLGIGSTGQLLTVIQNAPIISTPLVAPVVTAGIGSGSLSNGSQYDFAYAWQSIATPDGGITPISPITVFTATSTGIVSVQAPASPLAGATLLVYAATHNGTLQQQGTLPSASINTTNSLSVASILTGSVPTISNTTGGLSPTWKQFDVLAQIPILGSANLSASTSIGTSNLPPAFGASGFAHGVGAVPDPGTTLGLTRYLREDSTWQILPSGPSPIVPVRLIATAAMVAIPTPGPFGSSGPAHSAGVVPDPGAVAGLTRYLREDSTWQVVADGPSPIVSSQALAATTSLIAIASTPRPLAYVLLQEQQVSGTAGGTFTNGSWRTRLLNSGVTDTAGISVLAGNQVTLPAGTYRATWLAVGYQVGHNQTRLQNTTDSLTLGYGTVSVAVTASSTSASTGSCRFTIGPIQKAIALQHQCETTEALDGFGSPGSFGGNEVYSQLEIWREA